MSKNSSNASFKTSSKKGKVYVEIKSEKESLNTANINQKGQTKKAPKRPSRGQKLFLSSVLSLLSQSSAGTQFPSPLEEKKHTIKKMIKSDEIDNIYEEVYRKRRFSYYEKDPVDEYTKDQPKEITIDTEKDRKKKKYRSKILNITYPSDSFEVLKYNKKNIEQAPSVDETEEDDDDQEMENIKWAEFLPRLVQPNSDEIAQEKEKKMNHLLKELSEGRKVHEKRITQIETSENNDEPPTLVSEIKKNTTKDPGFYNFFVDLLETTFSVYDIKSDYDMQGSAFSSKVDLEMDEAVAKKLKITTDSRRPSIHSIYNKRENTIFQDKKSTYNDVKFSDYYQVEYPPVVKTRRPKEVMKKKNKSDCIFQFKRKEERQDPRMYSQSYYEDKKITKKTKKQELLNLLKEELSVPPFEEPRSMFDALKLLAKTKRKSQKTLRFEKKIDTITEDGYRTKKINSRKARFNSERFSRNSNSFDTPKYNRNRKSFDFNRITREKSSERRQKWSNESLQVFSVHYDNAGRRILSKKGGPMSNISSHFTPAQSFYKNLDFDY